MDDNISFDELFANVKLFLNSHNTISIASSHNKEISAASVFYVSDDELNIYFLSFDKSLHAQHILNNKDIAATINKDVEDWTDIKGLQIKGFAKKINPEKKENILIRYKDKFKYINQILDKPNNSNEEKIAQQFQVISVFVFKPQAIRLIDNSLGFGKKLELVSSDDVWKRSN